MAKANGNGKSLRFAALIRVSTEKQERQGESLRTQRKQIESDVLRLGGRVVNWYGGQEHATPGFEHGEVDRLVADAAKREFDAVIVTHPDRWSRDNAKSKVGLEILRKHRIQFYVGATEQDLFNPTHRLFLGMSAEFGEFQALNQSKKSIENRIERARRAAPTAGKLPFGRTFDKAAGNWGVDEKKVAMIRDVAERYIAGESLTMLAKEYRTNHANLCKTLRERCGDEWVIEFRVEDLDIHETVTIAVPRLLPEKTIRQIRQRLVANRTYVRSGGRPKYNYLLSGRVFCDACGYTMCGQANGNGDRYYRHAYSDRERPCLLKEPRPWVRADKIEAAVVHDLFKMLGNPAAIERAVKAAVPDCEKALKQRDRIEAELAKIDKVRSRILSLIEKDAITDGQAENKLREQKDREAEYRSQLDKLATTLSDVPDAETVRIFVERIGESIFLLDDEGNQYAGGNSVASFLAMTEEDRRELIDFAFGPPLPDGTPTGVYLTPAGGERFGPKRFSYALRGRIGGNSKRVMPRSSSRPARIRR